MFPITKKIIVCGVVFVFCFLCFFFGQCAGNGTNNKLRKAIIDLQATNTELDKKYTELKSHVGEAKKELDKLKNYQLTNEKDIRKYKETIREYADIVNRIETNKTAAGNAIDRAIETVKKIKELISAEDGN